MKQFWKRAAVAIVSLALLAGMPPAAGAASDEVEAALASMTLREKVGQLFAVRPEALDFEQRSGGMKLTCSMREHLRSYPVGGIVLFATNISSQSQMTALIRDFQRSAGNSLLVAVDEEGGPVARLANSSAFDLPKFPSASAIGTTGDPEQARTMGRTIGGYLKHYGFNLDLAPVADVNSNPLNPVIGRRAFSSDPDVTAGMVRAAVQGFHEAGMLCTLKHFPGHGDTLEDSHAGTATSTKTWEEMKAVELLPFEAGIAAGADVVMAAHITTPNATEDGLPASLSYTILTERLRGELGFTGVICTDGLGMKAITDHYSPAEAAIAALDAGADLLLLPADLQEAFDGVVAAVESGRISEERLDESVRRILTLKEKADLSLRASTHCWTGSPGSGTEFSQKSQNGLLLSCSRPFFCYGPITNWNLLCDKSQMYYPVRAFPPGRHDRSQPTSSSPLQPVPPE